MPNVLLPLALLVGLAAGCGRSNLPDHAVPVFKVGGTLTHKGAPMGKAIVTFHPAAPAPGDVKTKPPVATATADEQGRYVLSTYNAGDGAPEGPYTVTVYWPQDVKKKAKASLPEDDEPLGPDRLKKQYADPKTSKLTATVGKSENTIDFNLP
ncbi:hypothetical protein R5W24_001823 [Gemmata sp. JC717]|uniref:hypothetical protein n=1 Tax=Gemmata algarum TaxID=2975278 RepID=UPI0021BA8A4F|nr:hypothetical protein [Gemmata algarum]MDY3552735.1 hypothetical protein [Gemmata algarum]